MAKTKQQTKNWRKIRLGEVFNISREFGGKIKVSEYKKEEKFLYTINAEKYKC